MLWVITIFIIIFILCGISVKHEDKQEQERIDADPNYVPLANRSWIRGQYVGGLLNLVAPKKMEIEFFPDYAILKWDKIERKVPKNDINFVGVKTNHQLVQEVNIGKLLILGGLALALKDTKTKIENYLLIKFKTDGEEKNIILADCSNQKLQECIKYYERYYKNK